VNVGESDSHVDVSWVIECTKESGAAAHALQDAVACFLSLEKQTNLGLP